MSEEQKNGIGVVGTSGSDMSELRKYSEAAFAELGELMLYYAEHGEFPKRKRSLWHRTRWFIRDLRIDREIRDLW